jgi:cytochrome P450
MNVACIVATPRAYKALQIELDRNAASLSNPVQESEARALPYLQACIREGLRLYPPSVAGLYKRVPKGGDVVSGVWLPEGTDIGACIWTLNRRKEIWGDDALSYRPERWLEMDEEQYTTMSSIVELTFGTGKYTCLGKAIALAELNKSLAEVSRPDSKVRFMKCLTQ